MNKTLKYIFVALVVIVIALGSFAGGFVSGHMLPFTGLPIVQDGQISMPAPTTSPEQQAATPEDVQVLFAPFWEAWNLFHEN